MPYCDVMKLHGIGENSNPFIYQGSGSHDWVEMCSMSTPCGLYERFVVVFHLKADKQFIWASNYKIVLA